MKKTKKMNRLPNSMEDHHLNLFLKPGCRASFKLLITLCDVYYIDKKYNLFSSYINIPLTLYRVRNKQIGTSRTTNSSTKMARSARGTCPPVKHSVSPLMNQDYRGIGV